MRSDLVDLSVNLVHQTQAAILVNDGTKKVWLPKSVVEFTEPEGKSRTITLTLPERLAIEKGLV